MAENVKSRGLDKVRNEKCFLRQSWTKVCRQYLEIKQNRFFYGM